MGHAHAYRIRIDAEGTSASEIEVYLASLTDRITVGTGLPMHAVGQVIEQTDNARAHGEAEYRGSWFKGRLVLAPELNAQGCDRQADEQLLIQLDEEVRLAQQG